MPGHYVFGINGQPWVWTLIMAAATGFMAYPGVEKGINEL